MRYSLYLLAITLLCAHTGKTQTTPGTQVRIADGALEGVIETNGIRSFKGIPFAQPPVGDLRFKEPQPVKPWKGVRKANAFGPRAMQLPLFSDMNFRSNGMSEDCLYLNVWTPAKSSGEKLPVLVYFYGGGFVGGDGSEYRYDGESLATKGIVTITVNYRLGIFGFLSHPDLTKESPHQSSGNYGLLDQHAALAWVQKNITAFGGDPRRVTIAGESAGSISVCAQMASPLSKGLFAGAIGESGALLGNIKPVVLAEAEKVGTAFAAKSGKSLAELRLMPATELLAATKMSHFPTVIDGYFLPQSPSDIFTAGTQMPVPLLAGWNSAESNYHGFLGKEAATVEGYEKVVRAVYGDKADQVLSLYKATSEEEVRQAATDLATDRFIAYSTWKWIDLHSRTGGKPVYRYLYAHPRPPAAGSSGDGDAMPAKEPSMGAGHSWEIEYALGNLKTNKVYAWTPDDDKVSETMEAYFANFIKRGNPNGEGLSVWTPMQAVGSQVMVIDVQSHPQVEQHADRYQFLSTFY
ncbi:MAG TPA: carboxylesterase family protein [Puia sp.]|nr:carboxylesterase family protein [Puia sp.]